MYRCISLHGSCQNRCRLTKSEDLEITPDWSEILPGQTYVKFTFFLSVISYETGGCRSDVNMAVSLSASDL